MKPFLPSLAPHKLDVETPGYNLSTWEGEAGGSEAQGHALLHGKLEAGKGYARLCGKQNRAVR